MKAMRLEGIGQLFTREVDKPVPGPEELLVRVEACGVCGTDRHLFHGEFPSKPPVTLGHEFAGIIEAMGTEVTGFAIGDRITGDPNIACGRCSHCVNGRVNLCRNLQAIGIARDGGFADYVIVPQKQAFLLPANLDPMFGAFCEPLACCLHGIDLAEIKAGSSVVVLGGGVIGLLTVQLARLAGASTVILSTRQASRRELAEELGATASVDPSSSDIIESITGPNGLVPGGVDVVLECAGVAETVQQATKLVRPGGTVVILGVMAQGEKVEIEPFDLLFREVKLVTSFLNPFTHRRAADLIASGTIEVERLISRKVSLEEAPSVVSNPPGRGEVKVLVVPGL
ncbi:zinc-dependent alcohol dehydrogenase family protein [Rhizobium wuzhouense]|uniref:Iditol 2-dehydrogenase n=1 Tax=Rhizobium wuzhouense TaxID=1986026 RepID=A0ABX5NZ39_9HYPH|nr:zinc-dependent alcohol dehydrogenase family protein [Rhizobium wuzhouense]PYB75469.1 iditol 2-dehydrogenase [Rhizobium wuzhouense]